MPVTGPSNITAKKVREEIHVRQRKGPGTRFLFNIAVKINESKSSTPKNIGCLTGNKSVRLGIGIFIRFWPNYLPHVNQQTALGESCSSWPLEKNITSGSKLRPEGNRVGLSLHTASPCLCHRHDSLQDLTPQQTHFVLSEIGTRQISGLKSSREGQASPRQAETGTLIGQ